MFRRTMMLLTVLCLLNGCALLNDADQRHEQKKQENVLEQYYVPVQEYTGEGFELNGANPKTGEIAEANRDEVEEAVKDYFLQHYKTEVKVNNIVSAKDGVSVFVESLGNIEFYAMAIVPVDVQNDKVETDRVWSLEGDIEGAITSGLYVEAFREEFDRLDEVLEEIAEEYDLVGERMEMKQKTRGQGYQGAYYFVTSRFEPLYELYLENNEISMEELRSHALEFLSENDYDLSEFNGVPIRFYLDTPEDEPTDELRSKISEKLRNMDGLPGGRYLLLLNDNNIDKQRANGEKDNTRRAVFHLDGDL